VTPRGEIITAKKKAYCLILAQREQIIPMAMESIAKASPLITRRNHFFHFYEPAKIAKIGKD
jgi:hypothetical protein